MQADDRAPAGSSPEWWHYNAQKHLLTIEVHVQPGARRTEIVGDHGGRLKLRLAAPPVDGAANRALTEFLAGCFGVPRSDVAVIRGTTSRIKTVSVTAMTPPSPDSLRASS